MTELFDQGAGTALAEHRQPTPLEILQTAVNRGLDASQLEKLMDLQERWERNQAEKEFAAAMHNCQAAMPKVEREAENKQTQSKYANLESVQKAARPIYSEHGFSLCYGEADCPLVNHKRTVCDVTHVGGHTRRYHLDLPVDGVGPKGNAIGGMNAVQGAISTTSYGQRRLLCMIFNITLVGEDDDGQSTERISHDQYATLEEWIESSGANKARFLKWFAIETLSEMPANQFTIALSELKRKAQQSANSHR